MRSYMAPRRIVTFPLFHTLVIRYGPTYGSSYLFDFWIRTNTLSHILYVCGLRFLFSSWLFLSIIFCLRSLISSHYAMNGVFNIMSRPKTSCPGVSCSVVWYEICTKKAISANIPDQGSYSSRYLFCNSNVRTRFAMNW